MLLQSGFTTTATKNGGRRQRKGGLEANRETPFFVCPRLLSSRELAAPQRKDTPKCTCKCHPCRGGLNHVLSKFVLAHKKCNCVPTRECSVFASKNCVLTSRLTMHWELANHASVHHFPVAVPGDQICNEGYGISHAPQLISKARVLPSTHS